MSLGEVWGFLDRSGYLVIVVVIIIITIVIIIIIIIIITFYSPLGATQAIRLCSSFDHLDSPFST